MIDYTMRRRRLVLAFLLFVAVLDHVQGSTEAPTRSPTLAPKTAGGGLSGVEIAGVVISAGLVVALLVAVFVNRACTFPERDDEGKIIKSDDGDNRPKPAWDTEEERIAHMQKKMNEGLEKREEEKRRGTRVMGEA